MTGNEGDRMKWHVEKKIWRYENAEKKFRVEVHTFKRYESETICWNKYLFLYPGNPDFGRFRPTENSEYPDTPHEWNGGLTFYDERYDKNGKLIMQQFGDDYGHIWDDENPVDGEGTRVFFDAEKLIIMIEAVK